MAGDWVLLILDVIGAGVLAAALIIVLWRRAAHRAQNELQWVSSIRCF
jgi:hypothetical protein